MATTDRNAPEEVDGYLDAQSSEQRDALVALRDRIHAIAPGVTERVSYGIPIFRLDKDLVGMSVAKNHCALHTMSPSLMKRLADDQSFAGVKVSGATVQFTPDAPLPDAVVRKIIEERMREIRGA